MYFLLKASTVVLVQAVPDKLRWKENQRKSALWFIGEQQQASYREQKPEMSWELRQRKNKERETKCSQCKQRISEKVLS